jgi:hypothetical protein
MEKSFEELNQYIKVHRVQWEDKVTETGIQLSGGATVVRRGTVLSTIVIPFGPDSAGPAFVIKRDGDAVVAIVPVPACKFVE